MPAALKLMRTGRKGKPFYRVIVVDKRRKTNGKYIENLGTYNPLHDPAELKLNHERLEYWRSQGAVLSEGLYKLLKSQKKQPKT